MHLVYIDDAKADGQLGFSALAIPATEWNDALDHLIGMRRHMRESDGIYANVELHATDWLGGRGKVAPTTIPKGARARLYHYALSCFVRLPGAQLFNAFGPKGFEMRLFERLVNRIQVNMKNGGSSAIMISDEGKNYDALLRKLRRHNLIPSRLGYWSETGSSVKNIPTDKIIEDLIYRDSKRSLFVQAADFCAFALLRSELPTPASSRLGLDGAFLSLEPILVKVAYRTDPKGLGIIRV